MQLQLEKAGITPEIGSPSSADKTHSLQRLRQADSQMDSQTFLSTQTSSLETILEHITKLNYNESMFENASPELLSIFAYSFELLRAVTSEIAIILRENLSRDEVGINQYIHTMNIHNHTCKTINGFIFHRWPEKVF